MNKREMEYLRKNDYELQNCIRATKMRSFNAKRKLVVSLWVMIFASLACMNCIRPFNLYSKYEILILGVITIGYCLSLFVNQVTNYSKAMQRIKELELLYKEDKE